MKTIDKFSSVVVLCYLSTCIYLPMAEAGYVDGGNLYAGYHVMQGTTDPSGLTPKVGFFSGINSEENYLERNNLNRKKQKKDGFANIISDTHPELGRLIQKQSKDGIHHSSSMGVVKFRRRNSVLPPKTKKRLDDEAARIAEGYSENFCCDGQQKGSPVKIRVLMLQPKTHTRPSTQEGCCDFEVEVYWAPSDPIGNQRILPNETQELWEEWGTAHPVNPKGLLHKNHDWRSIVRGTATKVEQVTGPVRERMPGPFKIPRYREVIKTRYEDVVNSATGKPVYASPVATKMGQWMNSDADHVFVCHSQGCNNLWNMLGNACHNDW